MARIDYQLYKNAFFVLPPPPQKKKKKRLKYATQLVVWQMNWAQLHQIKITTEKQKVLKKIIKRSVEIMLTEEPMVSATFVDNGD